MLIKRIMKWLVDTERVARVIEVLDRRSDNRMTELGMLRPSEYELIEGFYNESLDEVARFGTCPTYESIEFFSA
jgi:hypothetical protein